MLVLKGNHSGRFCFWKVERLDLSAVAMNRLRAGFAGRLQAVFLHLQSPIQPCTNLTCQNLHYNGFRNFSATVLPASITVEPKVGLFDEKVKILLLGFPAEEKVTLHGHVLQGQRKMVFASCGHYLTDSSGNVDVTQRPSLGGTYTGVEPMGIVWSLKPAPGHPPNTRMGINNTERPLIITLRAYLGHLSLADLYNGQNASPEPVASVEIERWFRGPNVTRIEVEEGSIRGALYLPPGEGPFQGVIDMFGSAGGIIEYRSALLASRGFAALSLPYFKYKDLREDFFELHYEYFEEAVNWFSSHPKVCHRGIGVMGVSKGVENALCMGAYSPKVRAVVAINGYNYMTYGDMMYKGEVLHKGARSVLGQDEVDRMTDEGFVLQTAVELPTEYIPIWKGDAKYLVLVSLDDFQTRPGYEEDYLTFCPEEKKQNIEIVKYPKAGHLLEPPYNALCRTSVNRGFGINMKWGGYPKEHVAAQEDAWQRTLEFFRQNIPSM